jgi:hypothetical protein
MVPLSLFCQQTKKGKDFTTKIYIFWVICLCIVVVDLDFKTQCWMKFVFFFSTWISWLWKICLLSIISINDASMHNVGFELTTHLENWKHMPQKSFWFGGDKSQHFQEERHCYELIETNVVKRIGKILVWSLISP